VPAPPVSRDAALRVGLLAGPLAVFVGGLRLAGWRAPRSLDGAGALSVALADVGVLLAVSLVAAIALSHLQGWARRVARVALAAFIVGVGVAAVFQYGYADAFGLPLDPEVLAAHAGSSDSASLAGVVAAELSPDRIALLAFPFALVAAVALVLRRAPVRAWVDRQRGASGRTGAMVGVAALALAVPVGAGGEYARLLERPPPAPWGEITDLPPPAFEARSTEAQATPETRRLNVVLVILESVRAASTGPWGGPAPTPTLDSLAARGLVVEEMLAMTPYTNKTVGAMLSGVFPSPETRLRANVPGGLPAVGVPDLLRPHGYRSLFASPAWLRYERKDVILQNLGFDAMLGAEALRQRGARQLERRALGVDDFDAVTPALEWASERHREGTPFFLTFLTLSGHYPYVVPPGAPHHALSDAPRHAHYLDAVAHSDRALGRLVRGLRATGAMDSTLLLVVGDHGQAFGEHGLYAHGDGLYQEALHVPALLLGPGIAPGRAHGPRQLTDVVPTIADALGLRLTGARLPGRSLLSPPDPARWLFIASHHEHVATAARWRNWKAVCRWSCEDMEIYDLARDPGETDDLAESWSEARRDSIGDAMARWRASVRAAYPDE